jgi:hypothetical protein
MFLFYIFLVVSFPFPFRFFVALDTHIDWPRGERAGWSTVFTRHILFILLVVSLFILLPSIKTRGAGLKRRRVHVYTIGSKEGDIFYPGIASLSEKSFLIPESSLINTVGTVFPSWSL